MTFEHIVQINDLTKPELPVLTRFQVWEGLVLRARRPDKFLVGVDDYEIGRASCRERVLDRV